MAPENPEQASWFSANILPHEPALRAWLCKRFPDADNIDDIIQDSYLRLLKARESKELQSPRALLFRIAGNLTIDHLRSHKISRKIPYEEEESSDVFDEGEAIPERVARNQELEILRAAVQSLPERCRQIITLHEIYGMSQKEIAERLGIKASTVSDQVAIGIQKCTAFVRKYQTEVAYRK